MNNINVCQSAISENLHLRARVLSAIRLFFQKHHYIEVETPNRIPAPAPEAHIDALTSDDWYLHTSPELCMKRLLAAGYCRIYQICKCYRRQERGRRHLPEMTLLEWYTANTDYRHMMDQCEALVNFIARKLELTEAITYQGRTIELQLPWHRMTVDQAFERFSNTNTEAALANGRFDEIMGLEIEPRLGWPKPVILYDYPAACGALARLKPNQPDKTERFELYIGGLELCNAFSELINAQEQRRRFEIELERRRNAGQLVYPLPEPFLKDLEKMPPAAGNALGVDRLVMLFADTADIDEVVAFTPEAL